MSAPIPARRPRGTRTMEEMGMSMEGGGDMSGMKAAMERNAKAGSKPMSREGCATLAVMDGNKLVGLLTVENIGELVMVRAAVAKGTGRDSRKN